MNIRIGRNKNNQRLFTLGKPSAIVGSTMHKSATTYNIYHTTKEAWEAMLLAIGQATHSIYWEIYILLDDEVGSRFFDILKAKSVAGIDVKIILDYWGSFGISHKKIDELKAAGIDIRFFHRKKNPLAGFKDWFMRRTHRKILIVDERVGFVGGANVGIYMEHWDDLVVELQGKPVRSLLRSFAKFYISCGGEREKVRHLFKYKYRVHHDTFDFVYDDIDRKKSNIKQKYLEAIYKARERVILFSPYYFPDSQFLKALWHARKRGVRIDLLIPFRSDVRFATYAAYAWFSLMTTFGIRIHLSKKMMHGKGVVVDDDLAFVGTSNLEHMSFKFNQEVNVSVTDKGAVARVKHILERWIEDANELDETKWNKRGWWIRLKEKIARKLYAFWFEVK